MLFSKNPIKEKKETVHEVVTQTWFHHLENTYNFNIESQVVISDSEFSTDIQILSKCESIITDTDMCSYNYRVVANLHCDVRRDFTT